MMEQLGIKTLRPGADGMNPQAANYQNTDEARANPYPSLPDPLTLNNGQKVTTPEMWWEQRRPEIVEAFDREVYGRVPKDAPKVTWELTSITRTNNGTIPVIIKHLVGHVDNSSYPLISVHSVDIDRAGWCHRPGASDVGIWFRLQPFPARDKPFRRNERFPPLSRTWRAQLAGTGFVQRLGLRRHDSGRFSGR